MSFSLPHPATSPAGNQALSIRLEEPRDDEWIERLHEVSFGPGRFARAAFRVRERFALDPSLCFIAELDGERAASLRMTPISIGGINGYLLGPLMTDPAFRKQGAGRALVRHAAAEALTRESVEFVLLVGDYAYYGPLGFVPTVPHAVTFPAPVDPARVLALSSNPDIAASLKGAIARFI